MSDTGSDGCVYSGTGTIGTPAPKGPHGGLTLDYLSGRYSGYSFVLTPKPPLYMIHTSCDNEFRLPLPGPTEPMFFNTGVTAGRYQPLPFGTSKLDSQYQGGTTYPETWYWTLD